MNRVLSVDPLERTATVEPGVINLALKKAAAAEGLFYPPDPGSVEISTIGGNAATDAGGFCCVKYGVTRDFIRSLKIVLADGTLLSIGRMASKGSAGLDLAQVFIGSEGCLGLIVEVTVELLPARPAPLTAVAFFPDARSAASVVFDYRQTGGDPALLEFMDATTIAMVNDYGNFGLPGEAGAMLIVQVDSDGEGGQAKRDLEKFVEIAQGHGALEAMYSDDSADSELLIASRRAVGPALSSYAEGRGAGKLSEDVCMPIRAIPDFIERLATIRANAAEVLSATCGHAGDGNFHPALIFDNADPDSVAVANRVFGDIMAASLDMGGTITGEHGVGSLKRGWLARELSPAARDVHRRMKESIDPKRILNPGKMFDSL